MIAGPNGSGKTILTNDLLENYELNFGYYVNADKIEELIRKNGRISFRRFGLNCDDTVFRDFYDRHALKSRSEAAFTVKRNTFYLLSPLAAQTYFPTLFADFLREQLLEHHISFSFETVMSDKGKLKLLQEAKAAGYRTYLYYICTEDALINIDRVADRVHKNGHDVPRDKIVNRYGKSLKNLLDAIKLTSRAFLFDNSGREHKLVAEIIEGKEINFDPSFVPNWFDKYVLNKLKK